METKILEIPFNVLTFKEALDKLVTWMDIQHNHIIVTPNPEGVMQARRNPEFAKALQNADLRLADGIGIVLASKFIGKPLPQRVRGVDIIFALFNQLTESNRKFTAYFLGAALGVAEKAKEAMEEKYPCLTVVGYHHGFFSEEDEKVILADIEKQSPDILLVCTGMPRAEIWASKNRDINTRLTLCLGGTLDIMGGAVQLAPKIFRQFGFEWLYRLFKQPSRAKRMLDIPRFIFAVLRTRVK